MSGTFLASALYTGETLAFFPNRLEIFPYQDISHMVSEKYGMVSLRSLLEIWSSPGAQELDIHGARCDFTVYDNL